jgi:hypothetical protein
MLSPNDDGDLARYGAGYRASIGSIRLTALTAALARLIAASDEVADALKRHDHPALIESNARTDALVGEVNSLTASLTEEEKGQLDQVGVTALCARLGASARRNAYLIEQAWAVDAALMRLLASIGRVNADGSAGGYGTPPSPTYVDRQA